MNLEQNKFLRFQINPSFMKFQKNKKEKENEIMKRIKKVASIVLAMAMVFAMTLTAFAADNNPHTITVTQNADDKTSHTYEAYQIFKGDLAEKDGKKVLSNIEWGAGVDASGLLTDLKSDATIGIYFAECKNAVDVAEALGKKPFSDTTGNQTGDTDVFARIAENHLTKTVAGTAKGTGNLSINVVGSGYYLVKDADKSVDSENGAYTRFMLRVVGDAEAVVKSEVPSGTKKVYNDPETATDANNATIGSHVSYVINSNVPNYTGYKYYYLIMNDTLSSGLTFDGVESVAVKIGDVELTRGIDYYVYVGEEADGNTFRLAFKDIMEKNADGSYKYKVDAPIVVTYSATVNKDAVVGVEGNPNKWTLQYSNNPDSTFDKDREDDNTRPGLPADETSEALGETPEDLTLTYLTAIDITKYANEVLDANLLAGAEFTLTGVSQQVVVNKVDYYTKATGNELAGTELYYLLKDGTYTKDEPTNGDFVRVGKGTATTTKGYLKRGENDFYVPEDVAEYNGKDLYKYQGGNSADYADTSVKYVKTTRTETGIEEVPVNISLEEMTGKDGKISFERLGAGSYTIKETVTPDGYNTLADTTFTIEWKTPGEVKDGKEKCTWVIKDVSGPISFGTPNENGEITNASGTFATGVINNSGSQLPSTGGIGTTIFYVVGGILVIGAGILLVTKRRMKAQ